MKLVNKILVIFFALLLNANLALSGEKWDMALAYGAGNFHSANATEFAKNVTLKSNGKLTIFTHPGGSLFKGGEIFRAVRTGQTQIGERFMSALGKEDPLLEVDSQPFLATNYGAAMRLYKASKPEIVKGLDAKGLVFLYAVPWPAQGLYSKKEINSIADLKGLKFRAYNTATIRILKTMRLSRVGFSYMPFWNSMITEEQVIKFICKILRNFICKRVYVSITIMK